jgi:hypothetical protein
MGVRIPGCGEDGAFSISGPQSATRPRARGSEFTRHVVRRLERQSESPAGLRATRCRSGARTLSKAARVTERSGRLGRAATGACRGIPNRVWTIKRVRARVKCEYSNTGVCPRVQHSSGYAQATALDAVAEQS